MAGRFPPRIFRRVSFEAEIRVRFEDTGEEIVARTANISLGGMFVISPQPRPVGTGFELEFKLPEQPAPVRGRARVVWVREEEADGLPPGMGVRFLELTPGSRELIFQVVERRVRDGGSPYDDGAAAESIADRREDGGDDEGGGGEIAVPAEVATEAAEPGDASEAPWPVLDPIAGSADTPRQAAEESLPVPEEPATAADDERPTIPPLGTEAASAGFDSEASADQSHELLRVPPIEAPPGFADEQVTPPAGQPLPGLSAPGSPAERADSDVRLVEMPDSRDVDSEAETAAEPTEPGDGMAYARSRARRPGMWIALAAVLLVGAAAWYWLSRGRAGEAEVAQASPPPATPAAADTGSPGTESEAGPSAPAEEAVPAAPAEEIDAAVAEGERSVDTEPAAAAGDPPAAAETEPEVEPPPAGPAAPGGAPEPVSAPLSSVSRITWEARAGGTDLVIHGDGGFSSDSYRSYRIDGSSPRQVVQLIGVSQPLEPAVVEVGTAQVRRVRSGLHLEKDPDELHIVIDLVGPGVGEATIRPDGSRLRLRLEGS